MKSKLHIILFVLTAICIGACENDRQQYDVRVSALNIAFTDSIYSFAVKPSAVIEDTVFIHITLIGEPENRDRAFQLHTTSKTNAVAGVHYKIPELVFPAGKYQDSLAIIVCRDESLNDTVLLLEFQIIGNENFKPGAIQTTYLKLGDKLVQPSNWVSFLQNSFGIYSQVKHRLIIEATGVSDYSNITSAGVRNNLASITRNYLAELNEKRAAEDKEPLTDELDRPVKIGN